MALKTITKAELIREVRIVLDQNENNTVLATDFADPDQLQTDDIIEECLKNAIDRILEIAPIWMLNDIIKNVKLNATKRYGDFLLNYGKFVAVPDDMFKLISVICEDWEQPVVEFIDMESPRYRMQKSPFRGIRGNTEEPVVALGVKPIGAQTNHIVEIYDTEKNEATISYIPRLSLKDDMEIPSLILQSIVYLTANLYYITLGNEGMAKMMANEAKEAMRYHKVKDEEE